MSRAGVNLLAKICLAEMVGGILSSLIDEDAERTRSVGNPRVAEKLMELELTLTHPSLRLGLQVNALAGLIHDPYHAIHCFLGLSSQI